MMGNNLMGMSVRTLRSWRKHQPVYHQQLNESVDVLNDMTRGVGVPRQVMARVGGGAATVTVSAAGQFKLVQSADTHPDHLVCRTWKWDGEIRGDEDILIAKPWALRRTSFDGRFHGGVEYVYSAPTRRAATLGGETEHQIIIPRYLVNDVIKADRDIEGGTGVVVDDVRLVWEARYESRAWAAVSLK